MGRQIVATVVLVCDQDEDEPITEQVFKVLLKRQLHRGVTCGPGQSADVVIYFDDILSFEVEESK